VVRLGYVTFGVVRLGWVRLGTCKVSFGRRNQKCLKDYGRRM